MARQTQLEFSWPEEAPVTPAKPAPVSPQTPMAVPACLDELAVPHLKGLSMPQPLPEAVEGGVFGREESDPIVPDDEHVLSLVREQASELLYLIMEIDAVDDGIRRGIDPRTGRTPKTETKRAKLLELLQEEQLRLRSTHEDLLAVYADAFGEGNAQQLDEHLHTWVFGRHSREARYSPGHPWFYLPQGDGRAPIPVDEIQPNPLLSPSFNDKLPRQPAKREQKLRDLLKSEQTGLDADKLRYQEIVVLGEEALSDYDRTIAYSNDEEAKAGSLALKYNHICYRLSRIRWLEDRLAERTDDEG